MKRMIVTDEYNNRPEMKNIKGFATDVNSYGNVMFYPDNGIPYYRICLEKKYVKEVVGHESFKTNYFSK